MSAPLARPSRYAPLRLVVLISGGGTTLANLRDKIAAGELDARLLRVISSHPAVRGLEIAAQAGIESQVVDPRRFPDVAEFSAEVFDRCRQVDPHLVVMGGFLKQLLIPPDFENRVMNIHPALIPAFCGKGYYGLRVHQAALEHGVKISGCTVHFVDNEYDHGPIILQRAVEVRDSDTPETLQARVFAAECQAYPAALGLFAEGRLVVEGRRVRLVEPPRLRL